MAALPTERRWFRFGLRTLLVIVSLAAVLLGILSSLLYQGRRHQRIAQELEALGAIVDMWEPYTHFAGIQGLPGLGGGKSGPPLNGFGKSLLPLWIDRIGLRLAFERIDRVEIHAGNKLPEALELLKELGAANSVWMNDPAITCEQLSDTFRGVQVRQLSLYKLVLPPTRLSWLRKPELMWLDVAGPHFSNPAIDDLPESLDCFFAAETSIDDEGLSKFVRLKQLTMLDLSRTPTTESAIESLRDQMPWCTITWEKL